MFIRRSTSGIVLLLVYVDNIAFSSNDLASINELKRTLRTLFERFRGLKVFSGD